MPGPAQREIEIPRRTESKGQSGVPIISTPAEEYQQSVLKVSKQLSNAGHPTPPEEVSVNGQAEVQLAREIAREGIGAQVVNPGEWVGRQIENLKGDWEGSNRTYVVNKQTNNPVKAVMGRIHQMANDSGIPRLVQHVTKLRKSA